MNLNPTKCHYRWLGKNKENDTFNFENISLKNSKEGVIRLSFDIRVKKFVEKQVIRFVHYQEHQII